MADRSTLLMSRAMDFSEKRSSRQRLVDILAADQVQHQPGLLGRRPHESRLRQCLDHDALPPAAFAAAGAAGAAVFSALSALVVWPRNARVGANSPSLWPTMFSVT